MNGDLGLQGYHHQATSSLHSHQGYSQQQEPTPYNNSSSPALSLHAHTLQSLPGGVTTPSPVSLGQYVISTTPQQIHHNDMGYSLKMNAEVSDPSLLSSVASSSHPSLPPGPLASHAPPLVTSPSTVATSPSTVSGEGVVGVASSSTALLTQMSQLGPSERCTPSQAQSMGQQLLNIIAQGKRTKTSLPSELQNSFDVFHRCLAVVYGTFFLNLYTKANAPCLLCHGCQSLYPPGQFIHHTCPTLPPNILPCRSRMWRRCLVPLVSPGMDKLQQKQRWKYVLEKFSHTAAALAGRRNPIPPEIEAQLLEMPELKRGRFIESPSKKQAQSTGGGEGDRVGEDASSKLGAGRGYVVKTEDTSEERGEGGEEGGAVLGTRFQGLVNMVEGERSKEGGGGGSAGSDGAQNLLDIEPPEYDLDEGNSPSEDRVPAEGEEGVVESGQSSSNSALGLAEQLVSEVRKLHQELSVYRAKLNTATEIIEKMPSEACMREQLAQALTTQQTLMVERDQAREQLKLSQERSSRLQKQLDNLRTAYGNMEKLFAV